MYSRAVLNEYFEIICKQELGWMLIIAEQSDGEMIPYLLNRNSELDAVIIEIESFKLEVLQIRKYSAEVVEFLEGLSRYHSLDSITQTPQMVINFLVDTFNFRELE